MNLTSIKLAGFKSFVDPTTIDLHQDISVVVGPNGCGKSNILDAVRWVMGESAAHRLRGDVISDFIFSGSDTRPPASRASVELVFDNQDGRAGGEYAAYAEISVRREVLNDAKSSYYLNGHRCRRRDVRDVFLGTGFGTRGYSIIQQDWISQLVNSDPETLREHLEEAAGVSKYRTRRQDTLNKLNLTTQNLEQIRLKQSDLAREIRQLKTQATKARRYETYSGQLNSLKARLLREQLIEKELAQADVQAKVDAIEARIAEISQQSESCDAKVQQLESQLNAQRDERERVAESRITAQTSLNSTKNRIDQIDALRKTIASNLQVKFDQLNESLRALESDDEELATLDARKTELRSRLNELNAAKRDADQSLGLALRIADEATAKQTTLAEQAEDIRDRTAALRSKLQIDEATVQNLNQLLESVDGPEPDLESIQQQVTDAQAKTADAERSVGDLSADQSRLDKSISERQRKQVATNRHLQEARVQLQQLRDELVGIRTLQEASLGRETIPQELQTWLNETKLEPGTRIGEMVEVDAGWETAVEIVLGMKIRAIATTNLDVHINSLKQLEESEVLLYATDNGQAEPTSNRRDLPLLASKVRSVSSSLDSLFAGVYAVESFDEAVKARESLDQDESIVSADGAWLAKDWVWLFRAAASEPGVLERSRRFDVLNREIASAEDAIQAIETEQSQVNQAIEEATGTRDKVRLALNEATAKLAEQRTLLAQYSRQLEDRAQAMAEHEQNRSSQQADMAQLLKDIDSSKETLAEQTRRLAVVDRELGIANTEISRADGNRTSKQAICDKLAEEVQQGTIESRQLDVQADYLQKSQRRQELVVSRLINDLSALIDEDKATERNLPDLISQQQEDRESLQKVESELDQKDQALHQTEQVLAGERQVRTELTNEREQVTATLSGHQTQRNGLSIEINQLQRELGGLSETQADHAATEDAHADLDIDSIQQEIERLELRMRQLGLINYRATTDLEERTEEKESLDLQIEDLEKAMNTLQRVIERIDIETKRSLRTTFEAVNANLGKLFGALFGGGSASLEFTDDDILQAGVIVRARPPGKRNSTIDMLSGGERAMAAIAFVFALFELNPSPVCILDEVDAPLDERNVVKFAELLARMAHETQFVIITHNPATMELAGNLLGVTMEEAGVSRLVAVNLEDAYAMAANQ